MGVDIVDMDDPIANSVNNDLTAENSRVRSVRLPNHVDDEIARRADEVERNPGWYLRNMIIVALESLQKSEAENRAREAGMQSPQPPLAQEWAATEEFFGKGCGHTYEVTVTFLLPDTDNNDLYAYDIRDDLVEAVSKRGGRDVVTRIISLASMQMDQRAVRG